MGKIGNDAWVAVKITEAMISAGGETVGVYVDSPKSTCDSIAEDVFKSMIRRGLLEDNTQPDQIGGGRIDT